MNTLDSNRLCEWGVALIILTVVAVVFMQWLDTADNLAIFTTLHLVRAY